MRKLSSCQSPTSAECDPRPRGACISIPAARLHDHEFRWRATENEKMSNRVLAWRGKICFDFVARWVDFGLRDASSELREEGPERRAGVGRRLVIGVVLAPGDGISRRAT